MRTFVSIVLASLAATVVIPQNASGVLVISQYYEGPSTNKWIELFNSGPTTVSLTSVAVGLWANANAEGYKSNTAPSNTFTLTGTIAPGATFVLGNTGNTTPSYAIANLNSNTVINFNGNDSIAIYTSGTFATANLIDAIGFTEAGNQGVDKSFVRTSLSAGYNTTSGSNVTNFASVWQEVVLATVNSAATGTNERIGFSTLPVAVPEPTAFLFGGLVCGVIGLAAGAKKFARKSQQQDAA